MRANLLQNPFSAQELQGDGEAVDKDVEETLRVLLHFDRQFSPHLDDVIDQLKKLRNDVTYPSEPTINTDDANMTDAENGDVLEVVDRSSNGFIRGALRGLSRERRLRGIGSGEPFRLRHFEDGTLVLDDPATGQLVALNGFGKDNAMAFGKYLHTGE